MLAKTESTVGYRQDTLLQAILVKFEELGITECYTQVFRSLKPPTITHVYKSEHSSRYEVVREEDPELYILRRTDFGEWYDTMYAPTPVYENREVPIDDPLNKEDKDVFYVVRKFIKHESAPFEEPKIGGFFREPKPLREAVEAYILNEISNITGDPEGEWEGDSGDLDNLIMSEAGSKGEYILRRESDSWAHYLNELRLFRGDLRKASLIPNLYIDSPYRAITRNTYMDSKDR